MIEITENLHRAELTALERSKLVSEWCELTGEKLNQLESVSGGRGNKSGQREAARQLGLTQPEVQRSVRVASLSPEAQAVAEWCELVGENKPAQVAQVSGGRGVRGGESETARQLGIERRDVQRSKAVASLSPEAQAVAVEEGLDNNRSALLDAAKHQEPEAQVQALRERKAMKMAPAPKDDFEAREAWLDKMLTLWNKASQDWREEFKRRIGEA
jgi:hypothetical protein